ncbi:MAG: serine/threonine-protein kinase [Planctomycetia bacterium]|nr:serine/threonine-protein kinase [Planctomycetia bacterium]
MHPENANKIPASAAEPQTVSQGDTLDQQNTAFTVVDMPNHQRYEVIELVARGGMGVVYQARHRHLDKLVAIKITQGRHSAERFLREARMLAKIKSAHVVAIHDFDVLADGSPMLVMDWIEGTDLSKRIKEKPGGMEESELLPIMRQVAQGMAEAADLGIIHRDLKPANILIDRLGNARVADFGLARGTMDLSHLSMTGDIMGTPHFMAPEQAENPKHVDTRADIYSFGATLYKALTGKFPFDGESVFSILCKHKFDPLVSPRSLNPKISARMNEIIERCMAKSPDQRFASFKDLLSQLQSSNTQNAWEQDEPELQEIMKAYQARRAFYLSGDHASLAQTPDRYEFPDGKALMVVSGNIIDQQVGAIVSSDDNYLTMGGGTSAAIKRAAGPEYALMVDRLSPIRHGRVAVSTAGKLPARLVFHAAVLDRSGLSDRELSKDLITELIHHIIMQADTYRITTLAIPLLGTGAGGYPQGVCLDTIFYQLAKVLYCGLTGVEEVRIVLYPEVPSLRH